MSPYESLQTRHPWIQPLPCKVFVPTAYPYNMCDQLDAASIARLSLHDPANFSIQHSQTVHRLVLLQHWDIHASSKVLELGCGQGDCTTVLAHVVGEQGSVVAVDPAELTYGARSRVLMMED